MKTLQEILTELQALSTVTENQYEASLAAVVADLTAVVNAPDSTGGTAVMTTEKTTVSIVENYSDGTSATFDLKSE